MVISNDTVERIQVLFRVLVEFCRVSMGCFTSIFVTQTCTTTEDCDIYSELQPSTVLGKTALSVNCLTCLLFFIMYAIEIHRENWLIENLDHNPKIPQTELSSYICPKLKSKLTSINKRYWNITASTSGLFLINVIVSGCYLNTKHQASLSTISAFCGFTILLGQKIYYAATISYTGKNGEIAQSAYLTFPYTFNVIDKDHINPNEAPSGSKVFPLSL